MENPEQGSPRSHDQQSNRAKKLGLSAAALAAAYGIADGKDAHAAHTDPAAGGTHVESPSETESSKIDIGSVLTDLAERRAPVIERDSLVADSSDGVEVASTGIPAHRFELYSKTLELIKDEPNRAAEMILGASAGGYPEEVVQLAIQYSNEQTPDNMESLVRALEEQRESERVGYEEEQFFELTPAQLNSILKASDEEKMAFIERIAGMPSAPDAVKNYAQDVVRYASGESDSRATVRDLVALIRDELNTRRSE